MKRRIINKYVLLAVLVIAVFALPSCRTRITNNSEVSNIQYDEDGYLTDTYQMRRDELGLSTAERPLLPDFGSGETEENDDFSEGEEINYNPEDYQEDFTEPETPTDTNTNTNTNTNRNSGNTPRRTTPTPSRRSPSGTNTSTVSVTFNANGGTIDGKKPKTVSIKKGNKLGTLPTAKHSNTNMEFEGWFTSKTGGSSVKSTDKVNSSTTLYAHWKDNTPEPAKTYTVKLIRDDGAQISSDTVEEGKTFTLPKGPAVSGYEFKGWATSQGGAKEYEAGDTITVSADLSLYAVYEKKDAEGYWTDMRKDATKELGKKNCYFDGVSDTAWVQDAGAKKVDSADGADYIIVEVAKMEDAEAKAAEYTGKKVIVVTSEAEKDKKSKLAYSIAVLNIMHRKNDEDILDGVQAAKDLVGKDALEVNVYN